MTDTHYTEFSLLILIPLLPLIGAVYNGLLGATLQKRLGTPWIHIPAISMPTISFVVVVYAFIILAGKDHHSRVLFYQAWTWLEMGNLQVPFGLRMDSLSAVMCVVVTFVGTLIHIYSIGYMKGDRSYWRFFSFLNLFMFFMLVLVLADNVLTMFIGWEGVGLCSYLLISFWYSDVKNAAAGMKAFIVNRIGDFGFIIGVFLLFWGMGFSLSPFSRTDAVTPVHQEVHSSVVLHEIEESLGDKQIRDEFTSKELFGIALPTLICLFLFTGAVGKSAQIPLYVWLPDAMAGPTPVSALIHAATMVTAGVYMVARFHFLFVLSPVAITVVAFVGALTALFAATIGLFQYDIKKVLAYSTISQLGYMFVGVGVGAFSAGIFHLFTHAFFKGCLFLCAGSVIIGCHHVQDMRKMGGLHKYMPVTSRTYLIACCAIAGFPLFSGFFSKDEILWKAFSSDALVSPVWAKLIWVLCALGAVCTAYYMFRSYFMTFSGTYRGDSHHTPSESPRNMTVVLITLAFFSLVAGFAGMPHLWGVTNRFHHWLEPVFGSSAGFVNELHYAHSTEWLLMGFSVLLAFAGAWIARWLYRDGVNPLPGKLLTSKNPTVRFVHRVVFNKYYVDELYAGTVVRLVMTIRSVADWFDRNIIDNLVDFTGALGRMLARLAGFTDASGVDGLVNVTAESIRTTGRQLVTVQTGRLRNYLGFALGGALILVLLNYLVF